MPSTTSKNLGQVAAFLSGATAPNNHNVIWLDTGSNPSVKKIWDPISSTWIPLTQESSNSSDGWGSQVVVSDETLSGDGTEGNVLKIAHQAATVGQVLKWDGSKWTPANDETGSGLESVTSTDEFIGDGTLAQPLKLAPPTNQNDSAGWMMRWDTTEKEYIPSPPPTVGGFIKGMIIMWHKANEIPNGWVECNGNGGAQINGIIIPDFRGRTPFGLDIANTKFNEVNKKGGVEEVSLQIQQMPKHTHGISDPGHSHAFSAPSTYGSHPGGSSGYDRPNLPNPLYTANAKTNISIQEAGNSAPHDNLSPYNVIVFIIKVTD